MKIKRTNNPNLEVNGETFLLGAQRNVPCLEINGEAFLLSAQWNVPCLVAFGMFHAWWPLECSMLGSLWKEKGKHPFHLFPFFTP
jgi:hypothetical protein